MVGVPSHTYIPAKLKRGRSLSPRMSFTIRFLVLKAEHHVSELFPVVHFFKDRSINCRGSIVDVGHYFKAVKDTITILNI